MRNDIEHKIVERARHRSKDGWHEVRNSLRNELRTQLRTTNWDDIGMSGESMVRRYPDRKTFNDHLNILERLIRKNIGRDWNDFFSEICKNADARTITGDHLRGQRTEFGNKFGHLFQFVHFYGEKRYRYGTDSAEFSPFMVDENNVIRENPVYRKSWLSYSLETKGMRKRKRNLKNLIKVSPTLEFEKFGDEWWMLRLNHFNAKTKFVKREDYRYRSGTACDFFSEETPTYPPKEKHIVNFYLDTNGKKVEYTRTVLDFTEARYVSYARKATFKEVNKYKLE